MRNTVNKEIPRDSLEFGAELGAGEFGAVYKGNSMHACVRASLCACVCCCVLFVCILWIEA